MPNPLRVRLPHRLLTMGSVLALFLASYWVVTRITAAGDPGRLWDMETLPDRWIPHLPGTWPLYWLAYPFVVAGAGAAATRLDDPSFRRLMLAFAGMILVGAGVQIAFPARAPWPAAPGPMQQRFHDSTLILPYATMPSMHVAFSVLAAGVIPRAFRGRGVAAACGLMVVLITVATLTLKEHVVLDAVSGLALGGTAVWWWRTPLTRRRDLA